MKKKSLLTLMTPFTRNQDAKKRFLLKALYSLKSVWVSISNQRIGSLESQILIGLRTKLLSKMMVLPSSLEKLILETLSSTAIHRLEPKLRIVYFAWQAFSSLSTSVRSQIPVKKQKAYKPNLNLNEMQLINAQHCIALQDDNPLQRISLLPEREIFEL